MEPPAGSRPDMATSADQHPIVADLATYLPLGCIVASLPPGACLGPPGKWTEIDAKKLAASVAVEARLKDSVVKLLEARWIRAQSITPAAATASDAPLIFRLHVLPHDVGRRFVDRNSRRLQAALELLVQHVTVSPAVWAGCPAPADLCTKFDPWAAAEDSSLFYLFNTLPSPAPNPDTVEDPYARSAMHAILEMDLPGLNAQLYPFQARSAALMLQREASQELFLDPRLEPRVTPDGQHFYFCPRDLEFLRSPRWFESNRSGILAEGMGRGKTIIAISLILATKHHLPKIPPGYHHGPLVRTKVASLVQMAAAAAGRHSIPWKTAIARHEEETGEVLTECIKELLNNPPRYEIPAVPVRFNRKTSLPPPRQMTMCSGTIIVVPRNLLHQWQSELQKHVAEGGLKMLVMDSPRKALPPVSVSRRYDNLSAHSPQAVTDEYAQELATYDLVLFSRSRFELEIRDGSDEKGRRPSYSTPPSCRCPYAGATRTRNCTCIREDDLYVSPLKHLHWLRIMIDEGHNFSSSSSNAVLVAQKLVQAERRWVISGTPAKDDLLGIEVDLASDQSPGIENDAQALREKVLEQRRRFDVEDASGAGATRSLGQLATNFLQVRPWADSNSEERADWPDHVYRHEDFKRRTFTALSQCMTQTLKQLIVKTQTHDVERDLILPPLTHKVVRLEPSYYDKISANLFVLVLTANAVTSERTDMDYLFHPRSQQARNQLITNLRQSNFFWTGFSETDVGNAIEHGCKYLVKETAQCSDEDRRLLMECIRFAENLVLTSENWKAMSATHEIGLFVESWPGNSSAAWALGKEPPELYGVAQLLQAQAFVNERLEEIDPLEGFEAAGVAAIDQSYVAERSAKSEVTEKGEMKMGLPSSSVHAEVTVAKLHAAPPKKTSSTPRKNIPANAQKKSSGSAVKNAKNAKSQVPESTETPSKKRPRDSGIELPCDSPLGRTHITGTVSAKLSYLLGQVMAYYKDEKILIFYDGDNAAYYIAQCLDVLGVPHEIYSKGISNELRSKYIVNFDKDPSLRVLLMDVRLGALGLNVNQASRVYFINPVCRPSIEAQAVKRAHRIGQTKPVFVETLILRGTIEEAIFERSKAMTRNEHMEAKALEDDQKITDIIKNARPIPIDPSEAVGERQMAPLTKPEQLFGRPGRGVLPRRAGGSPSSPKRQKKAPKPPPKKGPGENLLKDEMTTESTRQTFPGTVYAETRRVETDQPLSLFGG